VSSREQPVRSANEAACVKWQEYGTIEYLSSTGYRQCA
jgi:hypothetical protein